MKHITKQQLDAVLNGDVIVEKMYTDGRAGLARQIHRLLDDVLIVANKHIDAEEGHLYAIAADQALRLTTLKSEKESLLKKLHDLEQEGAAIWRDRGNCCQTIHDLQVEKANLSNLLSDADKGAKKRTVDAANTISVLQNEIKHYKDQIGSMLSRLDAKDKQLYNLQVERAALLERLHYLTPVDLFKAAQDQNTLKTQSTETAQKLQAALDAEEQLTADVEQLEENNGILSIIAKNYAQLYFEAHRKVAQYEAINEFKAHTESPKGTTESNPIEDLLNLLRARGKVQS